MRGTVPRVGGGVARPQGALAIWHNTSGFASKDTRLLRAGVDTRGQSGGTRRALCVLGALPPAPGASRCSGRLAGLCEGIFELCREHVMKDFNAQPIFCCELGN